MSKPSLEMTLGGRKLRLEPTGPETDAAFNRWLRERLHGPHPGKAAVEALVWSLAGCRALFLIHARRHQPDLTAEAVAGLIGPGDWLHVLDRLIDVPAPMKPCPRPSWL